MGDKAYWGIIVVLFVFFAVLLWLAFLGISPDGPR